jgi:hypothetical protein
VLTKDRLEDSAEARVATLEAEIAELEVELKKLTEVDPARFEEQRSVPGRAAVKVLRYALVWCY